MPSMGQQHEHAADELHLEPDGHDEQLCLSGQGRCRCTTQANIILILTSTSEMFFILSLS